MASSPISRDVALAVMWIGVLSESSLDKHVHVVTRIKFKSVIQESNFNTVCVFFFQVMLHFIEMVYSKINKVKMF